MKKRDKKNRIRELPPEPLPPEALSPEPSPLEPLPLVDPEDDASDTPTPTDPASEVISTDSDGEPEDELTQLRQQCAELNSKYLRTAADMQNFARRAAQNVADARQQQLMAVTRAMVAVMDHFDKALEVDPENTSADALLEGMRIVRDELLGALEKFGVKRVEVKQGDQFDPICHEAMMRQAVEGLEPDRIAAQFQPGYVLEDKTLRPAKVSVSE